MEAIAEDVRGHTPARRERFSFRETGVMSANEPRLPGSCSATISAAVMESLRVPTLSLAVEVRYFDERELRGHIFLPAYAQNHDGPERIDEWLNRPTDFFPFVPEGEQSAKLLNKRYVVVLTLAVGEEELPPGAERAVVVECGTLRMRGSVYVDMPEHASRLLDWANRAEPFLTLYEGGRKHMVRKSRITFLHEADDTAE